MREDEDSVALMQLATRIPKELHRRLKLHCVREGRSLMDFIGQAIEAQLDNEEAPLRITRKRRVRNAAA